MIDAADHESEGPNQTMQPTAQYHHLKANSVSHAKMRRMLRVANLTGHRNKDLPRENPRLLRLSILNRPMWHLLFPKTTTLPRRSEVSLWVPLGAKQHPRVPRRPRRKVPSRRQVHDDLGLVSDGPRLMGLIVANHPSLENLQRLHQLMHQ